MKTISVIAAFLLMTICAVAQQPAAIKGNWLNDDKDGKIEIYESNGKYYGKLVWMEKPYEADGKTLRRDAKNKDAKQKSRTLLNAIILSDFTYKDGKWKGGTVYDPKSGKTYSSEMKLDGNKLEVRGYIGSPMFGRTVVFTRA